MAYGLLEVHRFLTTNINVCGCLSGPNTALKASLYHVLSVLIKPGTTQRICEEDDFPKCLGKNRKGQQEARNDKN